MYYVKRARFKMTHILDARTYASNFMYDKIDICDTKDGKTESFSYTQLHQIYLANPDLEIAGLFYDEVNDVLTFAEVTSDDWVTYKALYTLSTASNIDFKARPDRHLHIGGYLIESPYECVDDATQGKILFWHKGAFRNYNFAKLETDKDYTNYFKLKRGFLIINNRVALKIETLPTCTMYLGFERLKTTRATTVVDFKILKDSSIIPKNSWCSFCNKEGTIEDLVDAYQIDYVGMSKGIENTYEFYAKDVLENSIVFDTDYCLCTRIENGDYSVIPEVVDTVEFEGNTYTMISKAYGKSRTLHLYANHSWSYLSIYDTSSGATFFRSRRYEIKLTKGTYYCRYADGVFYFGHPNYNFVQTIRIQDKRCAYATKYLRYKKQINDDETIDILDTLTGEVSPYNYFNGDDLNTVYPQLGLSCLHDFDIDLYRASIEADTKNLTSEILKLRLSGSIKNSNSTMWLVRKIDTLPATDVKFKFHVGRKKSDGLRFSIYDEDKWVDCSHIVTKILNSEYNYIDWYRNRKEFKLNYLAVRLDKGRVILGIANYNSNEGYIVFYPLHTLFQGIHYICYSNEAEILDNNTFLEDL